MKDLTILESMKHSTLKNYALPGLDSSIIGGAGKGMVRLFECHHSHEEAITPHSHRFDFQCVVLAGKVRNIIWRNVAPQQSTHLMARSKLVYGGTPGEYHQEVLEAQGWERYWAKQEHIYGPGESYAMTHKEIHSIFFERGTRVLFFEGPDLTDETTILEPAPMGARVPTFETRPWMFLKAAS